MKKIYLRDAIYLPTKGVSEEDVVRAYTHYEFDDAACRGCELRPGRPTSDCNQCDRGGLVQTFAMSGYRMVSGRPYYTLPMGSLNDIERRLGIDLDQYQFVDKTCKEKYAYPVKFTGKLLDYQEAPVHNILKYKMGLLKSKPRTGKCVGGDEMVELSTGLLSMEEVWELYGNDSQESVPVTQRVYAHTAYGDDVVTWVHRKRSKRLGFKTHLGHSLVGTPEHPVFVLDSTMHMNPVRMDDLRVGDWVVSCAATSNMRDTSVINLSGRKGLKVLDYRLAYIAGVLSGVTDPDSGGTAYGFVANPICSERLTSYVMQLGYSCTIDKERGSITSNILNDMSECGLICKEVPPLIRRAGTAIRRSYLAGLISATAIANGANSVCARISSSVLFQKQIASLFAGLDSWIKIVNTRLVDGIVDWEFELSGYVTLGQYLPLDIYGMWIDDQKNRIPDYIQMPFDGDVLPVTEVPAGWWHCFKYQRIESIEELDEDWVYDLTVDPHHTFVASGFVVHNTVMATAAACKSGMRTIIMADQKDFLDGFYETIEQMTNLPDLEAECGRKLFGFPKTLDDFKRFQIILITYQQLIKDSKASRDKLKLLRENYGALVVDEVHRSCAPEFSRILGKMTQRLRLGLSATPNRKDCIVGGSSIVLADGSRKAIEDIVVGDIVTSYNIDRGVFEPKPVVLTHAVQTTKRRVRVRHAHGILECTEDHEVWTVNRGYVKAIDLTESDILQLVGD